jgi:hypothetical protein
MADGAWTATPIPPETAAAVRPVLGDLVDEMLVAIRSENPVYADVLGGPDGMGIRLGIEQALHTFLDAVEGGERPAGETGEVWRRLGEAEFQAGRSLDALRAAFRTGTRAAWRGAANLAAAAGIPTPVVISLAEAIFVYADELANDVVEGYLRMQSDEAGEHERRRRRLASLLLDSEEHEPEAIERAAELARWSIPRTLAVLALARESPVGVTRKLDVDVLAGADGDGAWLLVPDPEGPGRPAAVKRAVANTVGALGPTVGPGDASRSLRWARLTLALTQRGTLPDERPTRTTDHMATVIVLQDEDLAQRLVATRLAPLEELPDPERQRLTETLAAWLAHQRHTPSIATELHVHPQTVRYRLGQLHELLGEALDTPEGRFGLQLALRARRANGR